VPFFRTSVERGEYLLSIQGCSTVSVGKQFLMFHKIIVPSPPGSSFLDHDDEGFKITSKCQELFTHRTQIFK
jgi:hypothetical protein